MHGQRTRRPYHLFSFYREALRSRYARSARSARCQRANVRFLSGIEKFALAIGRNGKDLAFIPGGDINGAAGAHGEVPDIFCFWLEENRFLSRWGDLVDLAVRRCGDEEIVVCIHGERLSDQFIRFKSLYRLSGRIEPKDFGVRPASGIQISFRVEPQRPQIRGIRVGKSRKARRQNQPAVAAHGDSVRGAAQKLLECGLPPVARVLGERQRRERSRKQGGKKSCEKFSRKVRHRPCPHREVARGSSAATSP